MHLIVQQQEQQQQQPNAMSQGYCKLTMPPAGIWFVCCFNNVACSHNSRGSSSGPHLVLRANRKLWHRAPEAMPSIGFESMQKQGQPAAAANNATEWMDWMNEWPNKTMLCFWATMQVGNFCNTPKSVLYPYGTDCKHYGRQCITGFVRQNMQLFWHPKKPACCLKLRYCLLPCADDVLCRCILWF